MLAGMRFLVLLALAVWVVPALAVPPGYRYVGSRVVSGGRVVYWYWNADHVEVAPTGLSFVAYMYARAADVNHERPYVAIVRCDSRTYRDVAARVPDEPRDLQRHAEHDGEGEEVLGIVHGEGAPRRDGPERAPAHRGHREAEGVGGRGHRGLREPGGEDGQIGRAHV